MIILPESDKASESTPDQFSPAPDPAHYAPPSLVPNWAWLRAHPARFLAFGFGSGLSRRAPGTVGTLCGWCLFLVLSPWAARSGPWFWPALIGVGFLTGIWFCGRSNQELGVQDHSGIVWDEIVAFWLVLYFLPQTALWQAFGFLFFRLFDILKPPPIDFCDQHIKGGLGVMLDDLLAAFYTLLLLALMRRFLGL